MFKIKDYTECSMMPPQHVNKTEYSMMPSQHVNKTKCSMMPSQHVNKTVQHDATTACQQDSTA